jgi:general secretion pathway protein M
MATDALDPIADAAADATSKSASRGSGVGASAAPLVGMKGAWAKLGTREKRLVSIVGGLMALLLLWVLAVRPAWTAASDSASRLPSLDAQLKDMQRLATESRELRGTPRLPTSQSAAALKTATDALGAAGKLTPAGERATLTLTNASGETIQRWLVDARSNARARTIEAKLTRAGAGYSGTIVVALPAPN